MSSDGLLNRPARPPVRRRSHAPSATAAAAATANRVPPPIDATALEDAPPRWQHRCSGRVGVVYGDETEHVAAALGRFPDPPPSPTQKTPTYTTPPGHNSRRRSISSARRVSASTEMMGHVLFFRNYIIIVFPFFVSPSSPPIQS